ncbi:MAG: hypothetical protein ACC652_08345 [Acidimicrobiales bacterium]
MTDDSVAAPEYGIANAKIEIDAIVEQLTPVMTAGTGSPTISADPAPTT